MRPEHAPFQRSKNPSQVNLFGEQRSVRKIVQKPPSLGVGRLLSSSFTASKSGASTVSSKRVTRRPSNGWNKKCCSQQPDMLMPKVGAKKKSTQKTVYLRIYLSHHILSTSWNLNLPVVAFQHRGGRQSQAGHRPGLLLHRKLRKVRHHGLLLRNRKPSSRLEFQHPNSPPKKQRPTNLHTDLNWFSKILPKNNSKKQLSRYQGTQTM